MLFGVVTAAFVNGLFNRISKVNERISKTNEQINDLFYYTMSGPMYKNLEKLAEGRFDGYEMPAGLKRELYHLRDTGFIEITDKSERAIGKIPPKGNNLQQYVKVTDVGLKFVERRKAIEKQKNSSSF